jgi:hypothetical protein
MKKRHVFATPSVDVADTVVQVARRQGIVKEDIRLEARPDIEIKRIDDDQLNVQMDFIPAAWHGTLYGALAGFVVGLVMMYIPFFGVSMAGALFLAVLGALVGTWAAGIVGSSLPDEVRRTFSKEIEAGKILVVVDAEPEQFTAINSAIADAGGIPLPIESTTALNS